MLAVDRLTPAARNTLMAIVGAAVAIAGVAFWPRVTTEPVSLESVELTLVEPAAVARHQAPPRSLDPYYGLGTWIDGFDYSPAYANGGVPPVLAAAVNDMAEFDVRTLFMQSGRLDDRSPDVLEDRWVITEFLMRAAQNEIAVVAWYLPKWTEDDTDLAHLIAAAELDVLGYRFDGLAVDIEWNEDELDVAERNVRLVELSKRLAMARPDEPLGAIVLPPVQTEVLNTTYWPEFPWRQLAPIYDVWMPMSYWSFRTDPYDNPAKYNSESVQRLRSNLGEADALVHPIGGIGGQVDAPPPGIEPYIAHVEQLESFAQSLVDTDSIGGSIYDWATLDQSGRASMRNLFSSGVAAELTPG